MCVCVYACMRGCVDAWICGCVDAWMCVDACSCLCACVAVGFRGEEGGQEGWPGHARAEGMQWSMVCHSVFLYGVVKGGLVCDGTV